VSAPLNVISKEKGGLEEFLKAYWKTRLGGDPCTGKIEGMYTIGEQIPNYGFSYNDIVIARKSFTGISDDPCQNQNLITDNNLEIKKEDEVVIVIGSSVYTKSDPHDYPLYDYLGVATQPSGLVEYEMNAVQPGQVSVQINGQQIVGNINNLRVGPVDFDLVVPNNSTVADKMEYPIKKGLEHEDASAGGHLIVIKMNQTGTFRVRVDFDGIRGYKNRVQTKLLVG
jgi:hypothetical protein